MYDTYRFKDKDPVIDIVRTCIEIYASLHNLSIGKAVKDLSNASGVSAACIYAWLNGSTRMPRFCTVVAVVHATGREVRVGNQGMGSKPRFKSIKGGQAA
jgi:DNA-binding phage protein